MKIAWLATAALLASACSLPVAQKGESCTRSAQCAEGLACVKSKCSTNLQSIADHSKAPSLGLNDAAAGDGAVGDAASGEAAIGDAASDAAPNSRDAG